MNKRPWTYNQAFQNCGPGEEYPNYSSLSYVKTSGSPIYSFKDFYYGEDGTETHLRGKWFLMIKGFHYHHFLKEMLAAFLYYKNNIDDSIKILWIDNGPSWNHTGHKMDLVNSEMKELLSHDNKIKTLSVEEIEEGKLNIDELIIYAVGTRFLNYVPDFLKYYVFGNTGYYHFPEGNQELRKFFSPYMIEDNSKPKNIFITRRESSETLKERNILEHEPFFKNRYDEPEFIQALEDYFSDNGYSIVSLSGMSIFKQISYFYNAEKIAGSPGTNLCNVIFSKPDVTLTQVINYKDYEYPWNKEFDSVISPKYQYIDVVGMTGYEEVMKKLKESGAK